MEDLSGIFVKSICEGSVADKCGQIQVNDRIVQVDDVSLQGYTNHQAVTVLRSAGDRVTLKLERYLRGPKFEQLQIAIANSELKPPTPSSPARSLSVTSLPKFPTMDDEPTEIEPEHDSCLLVEDSPHNGFPYDELDAYPIDQNYAGPLSSDTERSIQTKWRHLLGDDVDIIVAQISKSGEQGGLGISLEGTVDVEDGIEVRPHHYIRSILPEGPVGRNGRLQSGDELLEVNEHRLLGMNHIAVVTILKELPVNVRMVCARSERERTGLINTSQDKAAFAARALKGAPRGIVKIGVAKPLPIPDSSCSQVSHAGPGLGANGLGAAPGLGSNGLGSGLGSNGLGSGLGSGPGEYYNDTEEQEDTEHTSSENLHKSDSF
ncbi:hypothetical protein M8J75_003732 [Diaphorina citri]|nr:hypothetical protein M8J75_003732 [Diaphorina citri]